MILLPSAFLLASASGPLATTGQFPLYSHRLVMSKSLARPSSTASFATSVSSTTSSKADNGNNLNQKPRILCLHGKFQSGASFSNKIGGARRKIAREYDMDFLDGPIILPTSETDVDDGAGDDSSLAPRAWWARSDDGEHTLVHEAFDHVIQRTETERYDAIIGFSQGGTLATALALSGALPGVRAVVTAGAPYVAEAFEAASECSDPSSPSSGFDVPKLHFAGERDNLVGLDSMRELCEKGGNGKFMLHDQGHLFPTRSARVKEMLDFLGMALSEE